MEFELEPFPLMIRKTDFPGVTGSYTHSSGGRWRGRGRGMGACFGHNFVEIPATLETYTSSLKSLRGRGKRGSRVDACFDHDCVEIPAIRLMGCVARLWRSWLSSSFFGGRRRKGRLDFLMGIAVLMWRLIVVRNVQNTQTKYNISVFPSISPFAF